MAIYKDKKSGKWFFRVYVTDPISGKRIQKQKNGFELRRDALDAEAIFTSNYQNRDIALANIKFDDLLEEFLVYQKKLVKETTYVGYKYQIEKHILPFFTGMKMRNINRKTLEEFYNQLLSKDYSSKYKNNILSRLGIIFKYSENEYNYKIRYLNTFAPYKKRPDEKKRETVIYDEEKFSQYLHHTVNELERTLFMTLFYSGLRVGELRSLTWNDTNFDKSYIQVSKQVTDKIPGAGTKTITPKSESSNRNVHIPKILCEQLKIWKSNRKTKSTFTSKWQVFGDGGFITENRIRRMNIRISTAAKLETMKIHEFRHSYTSLLHSMKVDPKVIQSQAGHASVNVTLNVYTHISTEDKKQAIIDVFEKNIK